MPVKKDAVQSSDSQPPPPPSTENEASNKEKKKKKVVSFGEEPTVSIRHFTVERTKPIKKRKGVRAQSRGDPSVNSLIPKLLSLGGIGLRSLLKRHQVERTVEYLHSEAEAGERHRIQSDQEELKTKEVGHIIKLPKNLGAFSYRSEPEEVEQQMLIVDKRGGFQTERSVVIITKKFAPLQRVVRTDEDAQAAFEQLVQIHDLGGLENIFSDDIQRGFRRFMMGWKLSVMKSHTKMKIRDTIIPFDASGNATYDLTSRQRCMRRTIPKCCVDRPYDEDFRREDSIYNFQHRMVRLARYPSVLPVDLKFKRLRDELFDPTAPAWLYEREVGTAMKGVMGKKYYLDDNEAAFYGSRLYTKSSHMFNPNRNLMRSKGERRVRGSVYTFYMNEYASNPTHSSTTTYEVKSKPELKSSKSKSKSKALTTVQASSKMLKSTQKKRKKDDGK